ncbi:MAG: hypothetical protein WD490_02910 [Opitutales bacterium]
MKHYPHTDFQIEEIVHAEKHPRDWSTLEFEKVGEHSRQAEKVLDLADGRFANLRLIIKAGRIKIVQSYEAVFLLENQRVRGVGYAAIEKVQFYGKVVVPQGWHQNVLNPNLLSGDPDYNRHEPLPDFSPSELIDFTRKVAILWNIVLPPPELL